MDTANREAYTAAASLIAEAQEALNDAPIDDGSDEDDFITDIWWMMEDIKNELNKALAEEE